MILHIKAIIVCMLASYNSCNLVLNFGGTKFSKNVKFTKIGTHITLLLLGGVQYIF